VEYHQHQKKSKINTFNLGTGTNAPRTLTIRASCPEVYNLATVPKRESPSPPTTTTSPSNYKTIAIMSSNINIPTS
jgi:hypothetical protein